MPHDRSSAVCESDLRFVFGRTLQIQTGWMFLTATALLAIPSRRFNTPSWQFIKLIPHGDDVFGIVYLILATILAFTYWRWWNQQRMAVALTLSGMLNWTLGIFLLSGALQGSAGGMGFPMALYPGAHMMLISVTLWKRGTTPRFLHWFRR